MEILDTAGQEDFEAYRNTVRLKLMIF